MVCGGNSFSLRQWKPLSRAQDFTHANLIEKVLCLSLNLYESSHFNVSVFPGELYVHAVHYIPCHFLDLHVQESARDEK